MKEIYILVTDGTHAIFLDSVDSKGLSLINHTIWPITRPQTKSNWANSIFKHATYGLYELKSIEKRHKPFGLPNKAIFIVSKMSYEDMSNIVKDCHKIRQWHTYHAGYKCPWQLKISTLHDSLDSYQLNSAHCIRAYLEHVPREFQLFENPNLVSETSLPSVHITKDDAS
jgi:hypothetical protein